MAAKKKATTNKATFIKDRLDQINKGLNKFEKEVEKTVEKIMKKGEKQSKIFKKSLDEVIDRIGGADFINTATDKTEELVKEARQLADDVVNRLKTIDLSAANTVLKDLRGNVDQLLEKVQHLEVVEIAKDKAENTRKQVFNVLKIPTVDDVNRLNKKLGNLEKKIKTISSRKKAA